ncbi:STAS domain-containing protein [Acidobacteria bacterium AB60]|nr:STAS domain-containing protein [Acidobacteria bacterium AB60]
MPCSFSIFAGRSLAARMQDSGARAGVGRNAGVNRSTIPIKPEVVMIRIRSAGSSNKIEAPEGLTELVRGNDHSLVAELEPLVRKQDITLDLHSVGRIDAAGIAALISLYGCARETGHNFSLCNVPSRVANILALVGLDGVLLSHGADSSREICLETSAA